MRKQVRRAQSLCRAARNGQLNAPSVQGHLLKDMRCLLACKAYPPTLLAWVLEVAHFHHVPLCLPALDWVSGLVQYLVFDCNGFAQAESRARFSRFRFQAGQLAIGKFHGGTLLKSVVLHGLSRRGPVRLTRCRAPSRLCAQHLPLDGRPCEVLDTGSRCLATSPVSTGTLLLTSALAQG